MNHLPQSLLGEIRMNNNTYIKDIVVSTIVVCSMFIYGLKNISTSTLKENDGHFFNHSKLFIPVINNPKSQ